MGEAVSKTAKAAMQAGQVKVAKKDPFDTNEKKIAELRKQRNPDFPLAVNRYDFIDALLEEYDKALACVNQNASAVAELEETVAGLKTQVAELQGAAQLQSGGQQEHTVIMDEIARA